MVHSFLFCKTNIRALLMESAIIVSEKVCRYSYLYLDEYLLLTLLKH